jgi:hypothetical protein
MLVVCMLSTLNQCTRSPRTLTHSPTHSLTYVPNLSSRAGRNHDAHREAQGRAGAHLLRLRAIAIEGARGIIRHWYATEESFISCSVSDGCALPAVLTTYGTLAAEFKGKGADAKAKTAAKPSLLASIHWWRVVLDEGNTTQRVCGGARPRVRCCAHLRLFVSFLCCPQPT